MKYAWCLMLILIANVANAEVYMTTEPDGSVSYSDQPGHGNAEPLKNEPGNDSTVSMAPSTATPQVVQPEGNNATNEKTPDPSAFGPTKETAAAVVSYQSIAFTTPTDQQTFYNQPVIPVAVKITPDLREGDKVQLFLDGVAVGPPIPSTTFGLNAINRGTHSIYAKVFGQNNQALVTSPTVTFFVHKTSIKQ